MTDRKVEDLKILFSQQQIEKRTRELADEINNTFGTIEDLTIICVLKGSSMFFCDLSKYLKMPVKMEFIRVSSYGNEKTARKTDIEPDFYGFEIDDKFVVGYGLDYEGYMRNLPYVGYFD